MRRCLWGLLVAVVAVALVGCEDLTDHVWTFKNRSSFTVNVSATDGQDWGSFSLGVDQDREVDLDDESSIHYQYSPSNKVYVDDDNADNTIYFYNR